MVSRRHYIICLATPFAAQGVQVSVALRLAWEHSKDWAPLVCIVSLANISCAVRHSMHIQETHGMSERQVLSFL